MKYIYWQYFLYKIIWLNTDLKCLIGEGTQSMKHNNNHNFNYIQHCNNNIRQAPVSIRQYFLIFSNIIYITNSLFCYVINYLNLNFQIYN